MKLRGLTGAPRFKGFVGAVNHYTQHHASSKNQVPGYFHFSLTFQRRTELISPHGLFLRASSVNYLNNFNDFPRDLCSLTQSSRISAHSLSIWPFFSFSAPIRSLHLWFRWRGQQEKNAIQLVRIGLRMWLRVSFLEEKTEAMES